MERSLTARPDRQGHRDGIAYALWLPAVGARSTALRWLERELAVS